MESVPSQHTPEKIEELKRVRKNYEKEVKKVSISENRRRGFGLIDRIMKKSGVATSEGIIEADATIQNNAFNNANKDLFDKLDKTNLTIGDDPSKGREIVGLMEGKKISIRQVVGHYTAGEARWGVPVTCSYFGEIDGEDIPEELAKAIYEKYESVARIRTDMMGKS